MALIQKDKIEVETNHGLCEIQLLYGSVTKLEKKNAVDVLVVSAFPGDYSPTPTSVIGALWRELKVNVRNLARDKEEDLRKFFSCWWSKPLPASLKLNFQRLLCFEGGFKRGTRPPSVVSEVFRSLVSLCKESDITVMMPLLAAGDQGYSRNLMLRLIVDAAIHWMLIGLPLRILKIVIYCKDPSTADLSNDPLLLYFQELKTKWLGKWIKEKETMDTVISYDVYLSYSSADIALAKLVEEKLQDSEKDIRIFSSKQQINEDESWQEEIYRVMVTCARVVTLLTPSYLECSSCVEQYNIALCCTRAMQRDYLAPLYLTDISPMPTYMSLIQYMDCRPIDQVKIHSACGDILTWVSVHRPISHGDDKSNSVTKALFADKTAYDVFISYAHANSEIAQQIYCILHKLFPDWRIFIDTSDLKVGSAWQLTLYKSIEASKVILALLSPSYFDSKVCQEEFNLSLFLHKDPSYFTRLIPMIVEDEDPLPVWCQGLPAIKCTNFETDDDFCTHIQTIRSEVDYFVRVREEQTVEVDCLLANWRDQFLRTNMAYLPSLDLTDLRGLSVWQPESRTERQDHIDVFLSHHPNDQWVVDFFVEELNRMFPSIILSLPGKGGHRLALLDTATLMVPLISKDYLASAELLEELNVGLCRQRFAQQLILIPIILEHLPVSPAFAHLLVSFFACEDSYWEHDLNPLHIVQLPRPKATCLRIAASCIAQCLADETKLDGQFKTIVSIEEMRRSLDLLKLAMYQVKGYHPIRALGGQRVVARATEKTTSDVDTAAAEENDAKQQLPRTESESEKAKDTTSVEESSKSRTCFNEPPILNKTTTTSNKVDTSNCNEELAAGAESNEPVENEDHSDYTVGNDNVLDSQVEPKVVKRSSKAKVRKHNSKACCMV